MIGHAGNAGPSELDNLAGAAKRQVLEVFDPEDGLGIGRVGAALEFGQRSAAVGVRVGGGVGGVGGVEIVEEFPAVRETIAIGVGERCRAGFNCSTSRSNGTSWWA